MILAKKRGGRTPAATLRHSKGLKNNPIMVLNGTYHKQFRFMPLNHN